jgi:uncharacterized protein with PQ loop repeat
MFGTVCGWSAMMLSCVLYAPQIQHMVRLQSGAGVSYFFLILSAASGALWLCYGLDKGEMPVILCNLCILSMTGAMAALKYHFSLPREGVHGQLPRLTGSSTL